MKTAYLLALSLFSASTFAASPVMVQLDVQNRHEFYTATVTEAGELVIVDDHTKNVITETNLQPQTLDLITGLALNVAEAKITYVRSDIICMMIMPATGSFLSVSRVHPENTSLFTGKLRPVLSQEGCWVSEHYFPAEDVTAERARMLKSALEAIVFENLKIVHAL